MKPTLATRRNIDELDALRGIASCGVAFFWHFRAITPLAWATPQLSMPGAQYPPLTWIYLHGDKLVELFFVISGFVFHHVYRRDFRPMKRSTWSFAVARFGRLWPLMFVTTCLAGALLAGQLAISGATFVHTGLGPIDWARNLLVLQVLRPEPQTLNAPTWSISVEVVCYALFCILAKRTNLIFYGGGIFLILVGLESTTFTRLHPLVSFFLARGLIGFFAGCLLYRAYPLIDRVPTLALFAALACVALFLAVKPWPYAKAYDGDWYAMMIWPLIVILAMRPPIARFLTITPLRRLGAWSYSIYLIHMPVLMAMYLAHGCQPFTAPTWPYIQVAFAAITIFLASISYRYLEVPARDAIRRVTDRKIAKSPMVAW